MSECERLVQNAEKLTVPTPTDVTGDAICRTVRRTISRVLGLDMEAVEVKSSLVEDLGLDSLDMVQVVVQLEETFGISIAMESIQARIRDSLATDFQWDSPLPLESLRELKVMIPEVDGKHIPPGCTVRDIPSLFTVETIANFVASRLSDARANAIKISCGS